MMARPLCEEKSREMVSSSTTGFCYSDVSSSSGNNNNNNPTTMQTSHMVNQIQAADGFVSDPEMFNLTTGMEMIGFSKNLQQQSSDSDTNNALMWKSFFANDKHGGQHPPGAPSSSKTMNDSFYPHHHHEYNNKPDFTSGISETSTDNLIVGAHHDDSAPWHHQENRTNLLVDDSSLRCVFPCEGNERPSQGLSLSLSSSNPSSIGLQSFELRQTSHHHHQPQPQPQVDFVSSSSREGFYGKSTNNNAHQHMLQAPPSSLYQGHFLLKNSKYLLPAQELLNEFCSLGIRQSDAAKQKSNKNNVMKQQWEEEDNGGGGSGSGSGSSSKKHTLTSLEFVELQKRKTKLLSMLEELDRRYKHYRNQMRAVVSSFESVAGNGAATVYSALALKAMSKYFRNLKDAIMGQIQATRKAMGEKDSIAPGTTRGETPRLKVIDQAMRQQRAFQQMSMMETHPWRPQRGLPERSVSVLRAWLFEHFLHPYPSDVDKHILARQTGLSRSQVSNWFINARVRLWKPMVEEMYTEELKEQENNMASSDGGGTDPDLDSNNNQNVIHNPLAPSSRSEDQKPTVPDRLVIESECATSTLNNNNNNHNHQDNKNDQCLGRVTDTFGSVELDFSSYTNQGFSGGVSLTLGLQQHGHGHGHGHDHGGNGVSIAFPGSSHSTLFYGREQIEDCTDTQPTGVHHQYSLLDGEAQNLPYRNLMGAQLLHDLAG